MNDKQKTIIDYAKREHLHMTSRELEQADIDAYIDNDIRNSDELYDNDTAFSEFGLEAFSSAFDTYDAITDRMAMEDSLD